MKKGISVFVGLDEYNLKDNLEYIKKAHELGYEILFTSAHISEATKNKEELEQIVNVASQYGMKVCIDVSKPMMNTFEFIANAYALRLDYGFSDEEIVTLSNNNLYRIELNASTISEQKLKSLINKGLNTNNIRASFNYYPKLYTGHDLLDAKKKIDMFHQFGISVNGFLPSFVGKRPPMYEGLPSIESHRSITLNASIEELKAIGLDEITFGDAFATIEELTLLNEHSQDIITLDLHLHENIPFDVIPYIEKDIYIRPDLNSYLLRFTSIRGKGEYPTFNTIKRVSGDVTIDNDLFKRYRGEMNIVLQDLPKDERVNVIGHLECTPFILEEIKNKLRVRIRVI